MELDRAVSAGGGVGKGEAELSSIENPGGTRSNWIPIRYRVCVCGGGDWNHETLNPIKRDMKWETQVIIVKTGGKYVGLCDVAGKSLIDREVLALKKGKRSCHP